MSVEILSCGRSLFTRFCICGRPGSNLRGTRVKGGSMMCKYGVAPGARSISQGGGRRSWRRLFGRCLAREAYDRKLCGRGCEQERWRGAAWDCGSVRSSVAFVYRCRLLAVLFKLTVEHSYGGAQRFCCSLLGGLATSPPWPHTSPAIRGWRGRLYTPGLFYFFYGTDLPQPRLHWDTIKSANLGMAHIMDDCITGALASLSACY